MHLTFNQDIVGSNPTGHIKREEGIRKNMFNLIEYLYFKQKHNLAFHDRQTKVYNRNWWELKAKKLFAKDRIYVTILDLNCLKQINDSQGHHRGDELIFLFSKKIKKFFPQDKICRLGGDEFLILSKYSPFLRLEAMKEDFSYFSYGYSLKNKDDSLSKALKEADKKMYEMKNYK